MIRFSLHCNQDHIFEAWFSSGEDFDRQDVAGLLACPQCGSQQVVKTVMAPAVATAHQRDENKAVFTEEPSQAVMMEKLKEAVRGVRANSEDVGERFPEEARKIHYGESEPRGIIGRASGSEVNALLEEGVTIMPLPPLPEDAN